jgi:hypothetical protein
MCTCPGPLEPTSKQRRAFFHLAGYVAGEGYFAITRKKGTHKDGEPLLRFLFGVSVQRSDLPLLERLRDVLGVGSICHSRPGKEHWQPTSTYAVNSIKAHVASVIPFFDIYLLPCAKKLQFDEWRAQLFAYVEKHHVRSVYGRSICSENGCDGIVRGRGLCRRHYYAVTGY